MSLDIGLFDAIVASCDGDYEEVSAFINQVRENTRFGEDEEPVIADLSEVICGGVNKYDAIEQAIKNTTYMMIYVSKRYTETGACIDKLIKDCFIDASLEDRDKKHCLFPIWVDWDEETCVKPFILRSYVGYSYSSSNAKRNQRRIWNGLKRSFNSRSGRRRMKEEKMVVRRELDRIREELKHKREVEALNKKKAQAESWPADSVEEVLPPDSDDYSDSKDKSRAGLLSSVNLTVNVNVNAGEREPDVLEVGKHRPPLPAGDWTDESGSSSSNQSHTVSSSANTRHSTVTKSGTTVSKDGDRTSQRSESGHFETEYKHSSDDYEMEVVRTLRSQVADPRPLTGVADPRPLTEVTDPRPLTEVTNERLQTEALGQADQSLLTGMCSGLSLSKHGIPLHVQNLPLTMPDLESLAGTDPFSRKTPISSSPELFASDMDLPSKPESLFSPSSHSSRSPDQDDEFSSPRYLTLNPPNQ